MKNKIGINPILAFTTIISVLISFFFIWQNNKAKSLLAIKTYEDCKQAKDSKIEENKCTTVDGREFETHSAPKEEKKEFLEFSNELLSFKYPSEANLNEDKESGIINVFFKGQTQKDNTELSDGYALSIYDLNKKTLLKQIAENDRKESLKICEDKVSEISDYSLNELKGYGYKDNCFGYIENIYIQTKSGTKYKISLVSSENEEYQDKLEKILSSLSFQE
jgi:hypothetical protein